MLDNVDTIAAFAEDMSDFLMTSEITESRHTLASPKLSGVDRPLVSDDYVVWTVGKACDVFEFPPREVQTGVFTYDLRTNEVRQLSNYIEPSIRLDGNVVVIREGCHVTSRVYAVFLE